MSKNVVIFSDGTGQTGGINFDEDRSNVYKLFRATRCGPDSSIDPAKQACFYDPGLGSQSDGGHLYFRVLRSAYNILSQATGLGITANIVDCYAALIRLWQPGDRIYLFGFSRGAYTIRSLASVISLCGIPTRELDGTPLKRDFTSSRALAKVAVKKVYQYTNSVHPDRATDRQKELMEQRDLIALQFRKKCNSVFPTDEKLANAYPHFIGAFDTVAALANSDSLFFVTLAGIALAIGLTGVVQYLQFPDGFNFFERLGLVLGLPLAVAALAWLAKNIRFTFDTPGVNGWRSIHLTQLKQKFYDLDLNPHVGYARHAISIDEDRKDFQRVRWGYRDSKHAMDDGSGIPWFEQYWFAGCHADIGGGYPEGESRLSDIALDWMVEEATKVPHPLEINPTVLTRSPAADGMQHDEVAAGLGLLTKLSGGLWNWTPERRKLPANNASIHPSVTDRFKFPEVLQFDLSRPYRPETLREHEDFTAYYATSNIAPPSVKIAPEPKTSKNDPLATHE
jgi:uncharacterized protein (DUF2235 family)